MFEPILVRFETIPIMKSLELAIESLSLGIAVMRMPYRQRYDGVYASLHGGLMMTLADTTACAAVLTQAGGTARVTTTDMSIRFLAPCRSDCSAEARVIKFGRTLVPLEVSLRDSAGVLCAVAQVTYMRLGE
jgi:1,4-dihydroxy-2-naphthoyl-CoA hydrolase